MARQMACSEMNVRGYVIGNGASASLKESRGRRGGKKVIKKVGGILQSEGIEGVDGTADWACSEMKMRGISCNNRKRVKCMLRRE
jgi:hypothetical protein